MAEIKTGVILGADTHKRMHTVAIISSVGQEVATRQFSANAKGYRKAFEWARSFGHILRAGIESTGSYGAGLCAYLKERGIEVLDVYAPDKKRRYRCGKDDTLDALQAAEAALSLTRCAKAKDKDTAVESAISLENAYKLTICQRTSCMNALKAQIIKLDDKLRRSLEDKSDTALIKTCASYRISADATEHTAGIKLALRHYAKQILAFNEQITCLDKLIACCAKTLAPNTITLLGIAHHGAVILLGSVGTNIDRMKGEASFSMLCGTSPIPASTGDTYHHRLNRGGDRKANCVLHTMAITRIRKCEKTQEFIAKKMSEGKSKKDAIRILKRYLAREVFGALKADLAMLGYVS